MNDWRMSWRVSEERPAFGVERPAHEHALVCTGCGTVGRLGAPGWRIDLQDGGEPIISCAWCVGREFDDFLLAL